MWQIDEGKTRQLLEALVQIDSVNPSLVRDGAGEEQIAAYIAEYLLDEGLPARVDKVAPGRANVIGLLPSCGGEPAFQVRHGLMLNGHLDTVGVEGMQEPFSAKSEGDRVYGRGSNDCKAGIVAALMAMLAVRQSGVKLKKSVLFTGVCDEEYASIGTEHVAQHYSADAAIVNEPTAESLVVAHKGFAWVTVDTFGVAAHGSRYEEGVDAISHMGRFLVEAEALSKKYLEEEPHPLVGQRSLHASLIEGGKELSTYPDWCRARFERRTLPAEEPGCIGGEMEDILLRLKQHDPRFSAQVSLDFTRKGYELNTKEPVVRAVYSAHRKVGREVPSYAGSSGWMDSAVLGEAGIPTLVYGPRGHGSHALSEYTELSSVMRCAKVLAESIVLLCS